MGAEMSTTEAVNVLPALKICPQSGEACDQGDACMTSRRLLNDRDVIGGVGIECIKAARLVMLLQDAFGEREDYRPVVGNGAGE